ncbi:MAG: hypothetical protein ACR2PT_10035 [Endozoicomonas sp.]
MNKHRFLREVTRQIEAIYRSKKAGTSPGEKEKHRCEGFMQAGVYMRIVTNDDLNELMEKKHVEILGETIEERRRREREKTSWPRDIINYSEYESPAFERK